MNDKLRKARAADNAATKITPKQTHSNGLRYQGESSGREYKRISRKGK